MFRASNTDPRKKFVVSIKKPPHKPTKKSNLQEQNQIYSNFKQAHFLPTHIKKSLQKPINNKLRD